ncbi:MAG: hypothetical protein A2W19_15475 [Spirochaetes bacterium RBG_16_49_21]|nr:MAG: hypothetical protein A2W19_15475 [Spirochaetes bacterium RBG_16_49_21]
MKKRIYLVILGFFIIISLGPISCSDSESRMSPLLNQATVILSIGLPPEDPSAYNNSLGNKIRRFFVPDAIAQTAPASFSSILVRVSGPDFGVMEQTFGPSGTVSLSVPSGNFRQFEVIAAIASGDPSAALSFRGTAVANLPAGETVSIPVLMGLNETKIVVPDYYNNRIVTIDSMTGANWNARATLGSTSVTQPTDVSFDARGRIYISLNSTNGVIRADNSNGTNATPAFGAGGLQTIAVDRTNNILYYASSGALYKNSLDGTNEQSLLNFAPITAIYGIDVYSNGLLLIVGTGVISTVTPSYIILYDPNAGSRSGQTVVGQYTSASLNTPWDVMTVPPYIYVANLGGGANNQILRFSLDSNNSFIPQGNYGTFGTTATPGIFYGARRFLAIRNDALIIADSNTISLSQLISISDISGANWTPFGTHGSLINQFKLWAVC